MATKANDRLTAAQEILLGAYDLAAAGKIEFSEWDLTVATWKRNQNRFGARGYESMYPDHKRVMMEIMGTTKKDNPLRRGWFERTRPNHYRLTNIGKADAENIKELKTGSEKMYRSAAPIYDAVAEFYRKPIFRNYCKDPAEPRMWLGAASFYGLVGNDPTHVADRRKAVHTSIKNALDWLAETNSDKLHRGVTGGGEAISKDSLLKLKEFSDQLEKRFAPQFDAINRTRKA